MKTVVKLITRNLPEIALLKNVLHRCSEAETQAHVCKDSSRFSSRFTLAFRSIHGVFWAQYTSIVKYRVRPVVAQACRSMLSAKANKIGIHQPSTGAAA